MNEFDNKNFQNNDLQNDNTVTTPAQDNFYNPAGENTPMANDNFYSPAADNSPYAQYTSPVQAAPQATIESADENIIAGVVGSFLFALAGGLLYFIIYRLGFIAGISGFATFVLALLGYQKFSVVKSSKKGVVISIIISVVVIFLGEYFGLAYEIYDAYKTEYAITFTEAFRATPEFLKHSEIFPSVLRDLAIAYVFGAFASYGTIKKSLG